MFALQQKINDSLPQIETLLRRYNYPLNELELIRGYSAQFKMRVPLVGAFSAGKSSLLNAVLGEKLLSVEVDPATSLATELHHDSYERIIGHHADQATPDVLLTREALQKQEFGALVPNGWIEARVPSPALARFSHVCLVDMPGLDSDLKAHTDAIQSYISRSLAYCIVMSVEDGDLHKTTLDFLQEIALYKMPVIAIVTKSDKKPQDDVDTVMNLLRDRLLTILPPDTHPQVIAVSRRKPEPFIEAAAHLESLSEKRYTETVGAQATGLLLELGKRIKTLLNKDDLDGEQLDENKRQLVEDMKQFQQKLDQQTEHLRDQLEPILTKILDRVDARLKTQLETLAASMVRGREVNTVISQTVRMAVTEGIQQDFLPKVAHYLQEVEADLPESIQIGHEFEHESQEGSFNPTLVSTALAALAVFLLPEVAIIALIMPVLKDFLDRFLSAKQQEAEAERKLESAREHILETVIPQVKEQVSNGLRTQLQGQINTALHKIEETVAARRQQHEEALSQLGEQLRGSQEEYAKACEGYQADLAWIDQQVRSWGTESSNV